VFAPGRIVIVVNCRWPPPPPVVTVRVAVPTTGPDDEDVVAVMEVVPELTGVATPKELTVATAELLDPQVTESVMSFVRRGCEP
jgi:hypothetical protein